MNFLDGLNDKQREAVVTTEGPLLVLAGAGSGKTRVLTHRIAHLIKDKNIFPDNILAITFTNKAANEMKERIQRLVDTRVQDMWVGTFHSMCVRILRRDIDKIEYNRNFVIFDRSDQNTVIKDTIKELNVNEKMYDPKSMLNFIGSQKDKLIDPDTYINDNYSDFRERQKGEIYKLYQEKLKSNNALDFDDLIVKTIELFRNNSDVLNFYQRKFKYLLVDEYQDTNRAQYQLIRLLGNYHRNVCVVGDDDQCVLPDMKIKTSEGYKEIQEVDEETEVISAGGWGKILQGIVNKKSKKEYSGPIVEIKTKKGKTIKTTPNHMMFGKLNVEKKQDNVLVMDFFGSKEINKNNGYYNHSIIFDNKRNIVEEYDEARIYGKKIIGLEEDIEIVKRSRLTEETTFNYMPAAHIRPSMSIPIYENGEIVDDIVEEVSTSDYSGYVYDISVPHLRQYICEDIVVHNSIYGWRGADIRNILDFEDDYKNAKIIKLEQNYRSTKNILDAANKVIDNNMGRKGKKLWTSQEEGIPIGIYRGQNEHDEASFITAKINEIKNTDEKDYSDFAILYRTNAQSRVLEETLIKSNIPYKIVGGLKFYDRKEIKDIIAYLRLIQNPVDNISLKRIINVPKRGIGKRTVEKLEEYGIGKGESIYSVILDIDEIDSLSHRAKSKVRDFASMINKFIAMKEVLTVKDLIENIIDSTGYIKELKDEDTLEAKSRIENIEEFISVTMDFEETSEEKTLEEFLANISLLSDIDRMDDEGNDSVTLMTLHSAKGLEYRVVFLTGMEEGIFPISRAITSEDDLEEERRLCYVGITRAEEKLFMTYTTLRTIYGKTSYNTVSRFIGEIPENLIDEIKNRFEPRKKSESKEPKKYFTGYTHENTEKEKKSDIDINMGDKVKHKSWGIGVVVSISGSGENKEATIAFNDKGIKKLLLSLAPIEKV
ncbi:UvrD-helicase domain-containing protein [Clostridium sp. D2Q-14]|uniref:UvrD-helicase domain-containing protein n=1 Tax=Anaeromonas gelatinilytica TaxID=2683194 RepID=UPI00193BEBD6|nr:UvrD-helicase domain-containing protein [Anaeromonas gelatinilytica]MBS4534716.1 UvrD-helicase domain-containing protein [Anaeromonas gelatinilytica]